MPDKPFKRILLKLSGESLKGNRGHGIDPASLDYMAEEIKAVTSKGIELGIVVGGGNIWRGSEAEIEGMERASADYAGMLATVISALALQDSLERKHKLDTRTLSAINIQQVAEPYIRSRAIRHLEKGRIVLFAAGTGNPFVTTDTGSALRALEIEADVLLMAKNDVDGVYNKDPKLDKKARKLFPLRLCHFYTDINKIQTELNWQPEFDLYQGLKDSYSKDYVISKLTNIDVSGDSILFDS